MRAVSQYDLSVSAMKFAPIGCDADRRQAAEMAIGRGDLEATAELERAERIPVRLARIERLEGAGGDRDLDRRIRRLARARDAP
jgi:hypothetical protein